MSDYESSGKKSIFALTSLQRFPKEKGRRSACKRNTIAHERNGSWIVRIKRECLHTLTGRLLKQTSVAEHIDQVEANVWVVGGAADKFFRLSISTSQVALREELT